MAKKRSHERGNGETVKGIAAQLSALPTMTVSELRTKHEELFGVPTRTRNKQALVKRLAWRIQELAEGGLTPRARARATELGPMAPVRHNRPAGSATTEPRDPRLPPVGTILTRTYKGADHRVTVLATGFEYRGQTYQSLSAVALAITGTVWNGLVFFGLKTRTKGEPK